MTTQTAPSPTAAPLPLSAEEIGDRLSKAADQFGQSWGADDSYENPGAVLQGVLRSYGFDVVEAQDAEDHARLSVALEEARRERDEARANTLRETARKATSFLVGDPQNGVPLRSPMAHEIAASILKLIDEPKPEAPWALATLSHMLQEHADTWLEASRWHASRSGDDPLLKSDADPREEWVEHRIARAAFEATEWARVMVEGIATSDDVTLKVLSDAKAEARASTAEARLARVGQNHARLYDALNEIRERDLPSQPMTDGGDELSWVQRQYAELRRIALKALTENSPQEASASDECPKCHDSGYQEFVSGGVWTGEAVRTRQEICDCACGDDVRREKARAALTDPEPAAEREEGCDA